MFMCTCSWLCRPKRLMESICFRDKENRIGWLCAYPNASFTSWTNNIYLMHSENFVLRFPAPVKKLWHKHLIFCFLEVVSDPMDWGKVQKHLDTCHVINSGWLNFILFNEQKSGREVQLLFSIQCYTIGLKIHFKTQLILIFSISARQSMGIHPFLSRWWCCLLSSLQGMLELLRSLILSEPVGLSSISITHFMDLQFWRF